MRLELESNPFPITVAETADSESEIQSRAEATEMLRAGIKAAQAGNRLEARQSLLRAAELDPTSESAWLWLSSISEYPEELFVFLSNVLEINPENARALEWSAATKSLLAKNFVQRGIDAAETNKYDAATQYFNEALEYDEQNTMAWLWLASLAESHEGKLTYLEKVLELDPENEAAGAAYRDARNSIRENLLSEARMAAVAGKTAEANELLNAILAEEPNAEDAWVLRSHLAIDFDDKINAFKRILEINPENAGANAWLESLSSIMNSVAPKVAEIETAEESPVASSMEESVSTESNLEGGLENVWVEEPENFEDPTLMQNDESVADDSGDDVYDGTIHIDFAGESPTEGFSVSETGFVDTGAETEFEPVGDEPLGSSATAEENDSGPAWETNTPMASDDAVYESAMSLPEDVEEITYELASEPEPFETVDTHDSDLLPSGSHEEADFSEPVSNPFISTAHDSAADQYPTVTSVVIDPAVYQSPQPNNSEDPPEMNVSESDASDGIEPTFGLTMFGTSIPAPGANDVFDAPFEMTMFGSRIPMPADDPIEATESPRTGFETHVVSSEEQRAADPSARPCSFCNFDNDLQAIVCNGCLAVLTLADLEMLLANHHADKSAVRNAVERMECERLVRQFTEAELTTLGIGHLNLRNLQFGYNYLHEASQLNPNNVVLAGQVNALLIRLEEIKKQDEVHGSMSKGKTILVVDDSPTVRKLIAGKLEKCGHDVFCSNDGVEAIERLEELRPDLVLLDITMPRMDGYQVCKLIRSNAATKDIPVIMISGKDGFFDKVRGRIAGTSGYITKPFGPETLMKVVESYLSGETLMSQE